MEKNKEFYCQQCTSENISFNNDELYVQSVTNPNEILDIEKEIIWKCNDCGCEHNSKWINGKLRLVKNEKEKK